MSEPVSNAKASSAPAAAAAVAPVAAASTSKDASKKKNKPKAAATIDEIKESVLQDALKDSNNNHLNAATGTKKAAKGGEQVDLRQTSLTDSIILIDKKDIAAATAPSAGAKSKQKISARTESNQSSSESLQDVDGDEGLCSIF